MDIKPDNTAYSPHFKKLIFLDFGFAQVIKEEIGQKTFIYPRGTFNYMNKPMQDVALLDQPNFIDLYDNDMNALKNTLKGQILILAATIKRSK